MSRDITRPLYHLMLVSGGLVGFFIALSREPIAGAVVSGLLSVLSALLVYLVEGKSGSEEVKQFKLFIGGLLYLHLAIALSFCLFFALSYWILPSGLDEKRRVLARFLVGSGLEAVEVAGFRYSLPSDAVGAAAALIVSGAPVSDESIRFRPFGMGAPSKTQTTGQIPAKYCKALQAALTDRPLVRNRVASALRNNDNSQQAFIFGELLDRIDAEEKLAEGAKLVNSAYCIEREDTQ